MKRIYCSNCGNLVPERVNFCPYCGAAQHGTEAASYNHAHALPTQPPATPPSPTQEQANRELELASKTIERRHLSPLAKVSFMLSYTGKTSIILLALLAMVYFEPLIAIAGIAAYFLLILMVALLTYNNFYFCVDQTSFQKQHGILHKHKVTIPFEQIQNVNVTRSLLDQFLGLARIDIETAGNAQPNKRDVGGGSKTMAEGHLPGITLAEAREVHDILLQKVAAER